MASMDWLWRRVCTPNCTNACKRYCPGCRARAGEWAARENEKAASEKEAKPAAPREKRTVRMRELARCAVDCVSADVKSFFGRRSKAKKDDALLQIGSAPQPVGADRAADRAADNAADGVPDGAAQDGQGCGCRATGDGKDRAATRPGQ